MACHWLELLRTAPLPIHKVIIIVILKDGMNGIYLNVNKHLYSWPLLGLKLTWERWLLKTLQSQPLEFKPHLLSANAFDLEMCSMVVEPPNCFHQKSWAHSSVGRLQDLRTGGCRFDPLLSQCSFQGFMIVIWTGFISLSLLSIVSTMVMWESC